MARHKSVKKITAMIDKNGFQATETFLSKTDADGWKQIVEATLEHSEKVDFDLTVYAAGLAETVRAYGGTYTMENGCTLRFQRSNGHLACPARSITKR